MKHLLLAFGVIFLLAFMPPLNIPGALFFDPQILFSLPLTAYLFLKHSKLIKDFVVNECRFLLILFFVSIGLAIFGGIVLADWMGVLRVIKGFLMFFGALGAISFLLDQGISLEDCFFALVFCFFLQGAVLLAQFYFPRFYEIMQEYLFVGLSVQEANDFQWESDFRLPGLMITRGSSVSSFAAMGVIIGLGMFLIRRMNLVSLKGGVAVGTILLSLISCVFAGRTGQFILITSVILLVIFSLRSGKLREIARNAFALFLLGVFSMFVLWILRSTQDDGETISKVVIRNLSFLVDRESGVTNYTETIIGMWNTHFTPLKEMGAAQVLFGDPNELSLVEWKSDVGYVRLILAYGIIGGGAQILICLAMFFKLIQGIKTSNMALACSIVFWALIFSNLKELTFFARALWPVACLAFVLGCLDVKIRQFRNHQLFLRR